MKNVYLIFRNFRMVGGLRFFHCSYFLSVRLLDTLSRVSRGRSLIPRELRSPGGNSCKRDKQLHHNRPEREFQITANKGDLLEFSLLGMLTQRSVLQDRL